MRLVKYTQRDVVYAEFDKKLEETVRKFGGADLRFLNGIRNMREGFFCRVIHIDENHKIG